MARYLLPLKIADADTWKENSAGPELEAVHFPTPGEHARQDSGRQGQANFVGAGGTAEALQPQRTPPITDGFGEMLMDCNPPLPIEVVGDAGADAAEILRSIGYF